MSIIGTGRVAGVLAPALASAGVPVVALAGRASARADALAARTPGARAVNAQSAVDRADLVLLAVPDDAIASVCAGLHWRAEVACVHLSGATELGALDAAAQAGAAVGGLHPLVAFAEAEAARAALAGAVWGVEAPSDNLRAALEGLVARLGGTPLRIPPGGRALYHAGANYAAAFLVATLAEGARLWAHLGVDEGTALAALLPLARGALGGVARTGLVGSLPGPLARGDVGTIQRHVEALQAEVPDALPFYREVSRAALKVARAQGLDAGRSAALSAALRPADDVG
ncbi:Domain of unknown function DUF2520-containing protein [Deinococcus maricopensis DSM 21211]|uniref:NADP oxidoreductase coenzyme F420-dependent n=1 Tax=Deinococcus maricopensis (strain DSM 21211 / LMG 22137 / NRRL B-23946 / LB-34) TaxID=709986 RepID=E8U9P1_DEIML|nr:Domain of unknown function DUF2520-containing protein [Deinococcus maricopensis DSM 21211]